MKVLYVSTSNSNKKYDILFEKSNGKLHYSIQKFHQLIISGLKENNNDVTVLSGLQISNKTINKKIILAEKEIENDIEYNYPFIINIPILKQIFTVISFIYYFILWNIKNKGKEKRVIIDSAYVSVSPIMVFLCRLFSIKCACIVADIYNYMTLKVNVKEKRNIFEKIMCKMCSYCFNNYDYFILLTKEMNQIVNPKNKPFIVMEGLVDSNYKFVKNDVMRKKAIMYAGGLNEEYGVKLLIDSFVEWNNNDYELWLCGNGYLVDYIKMLNCKKIKYFGSISNDLVTKKERECYLLVNPRFSNNEYTKYSFPSKNMEYMLSATPVLTTKLPGMPKEYYEYVHLIEDETKEGMIKKFDDILLNNYDDRIGLEAQQFVFERKNNIVQTKRIVDFIKGDSDKFKSKSKKFLNSKKDIYGFLLMFIYLFLSRNSLVSSSIIGFKYAFLIQILFSIPLIYMQLRNFIKQKHFSVTILILIITIILSLMASRDLQPYNISILIYIIIAYLYVNEFKKDFIIKSFTYIMLFLAFFSLISNYIFKPQLLKVIDLESCLKYNLCFSNTVKTNFLNCIFSFPVYLSSYIRNFGIFTEPAYYQFYLIILLLILLLKKEVIENDYVRNILIFIVIITILTTFSTAVYLILPIIFLIYVLQEFFNNKKNRKKIILRILLSVLFFIILGFILVNCNDKIMRMFQMIKMKLTEPNESTITRVSSFLGNLKQFLLSPIFGNKFNSVLEYYSTTTNISFLALYGIIPGFIMFKLQYKLASLFSKRKFIIFLVFICIIMSCNNHFFNGCISYWIIILFNIESINKTISIRKEKRK